MITGLYETSSFLITLSSKNILHLFDLPSESLNRLQSPLGISLDQPVISFELEKLLEAQARIAETQKSEREDLLVVFDQSKVLGLDLDGLRNKHLQARFVIDRKDLLNRIIIGSKDNFSQVSITSVVYFQLQDNSNQIVPELQQPQQPINSHVLINTTSGHLLHYKISKSHQPIFSSIHCLPSDNKPSSQEQNSLFRSNHISKQSSSEANKDNAHQYTSAISIKNSIVYIATSQKRLFAARLTDSQLSDQWTPFTSNNTDKSCREAPQKLQFSPYNTILVLYPTSIQQYNLHTHALVKSTSLPFTIFSCSFFSQNPLLPPQLLLTGQSNYLFNLNQENLFQPQISLSSRMGSSLLVSKKGLIIVGGSDSTVDVIKSLSMRLLVLIAKNNDKS